MSGEMHNVWGRRPNLARAKAHFYWHGRTLCLKQQAHVKVEEGWDVDNPQTCKFCKERYMDLFHARKIIAEKSRV